MESEDESNCSFKAIPRISTAASAHSRPETNLGFDPHLAMLSDFEDCSADFPIETSEEDMVTLVTIQACLKLPLPAWYLVSQFLWRPLQRYEQHSDGSWTGKCGARRVNSGNGKEPTEPTA